MLHGLISRNSIKSLELHTKLADSYKEVVANLNIANAQQVPLNLSTRTKFSLLFSSCAGLCNAIILLVYAIL
ncbi:hypothetical protein MIMGU_mgv1a019633mg [Erythranthe guttata]|uniref:Uncharacterized protein n=1 Tax=Erythranthe guttata TaxID=4155 RepID=A0A022Q6S1_ERYGU|nr:hypothetical protein MIMGU_mgv1a019633mg [Erythranthe guttata]